MNEPTMQPEVAGTVRADVRRCRCGRTLERGYNTFCRRCGELPRDEHDFPRWRYCPKCGGIINGGRKGHLVPGSLGVPSFYLCQAGVMLEILYDTHRVHPPNVPLTGGQPPQGGSPC